MLLEIDAQGSEGRAVPTKLRAEGKGEVRKMRAGSNEDQVEEHRGDCASVRLGAGRLRNVDKNATALTMNLKGNCFIRPL